MLSSMLLNLYIALHFLLDIAEARVAYHAIDGRSILQVRQDVSPAVSIPGVEAASTEIQTEDLVDQSKGPGRKLQAGQTYRLKNTSGGLTSVNGVKVHAAPIKRADYETLLDEALKDLKAIQLVNDETNYYNHRFGEWDLHIITSREKVPWYVMTSAVQRLINELPSPDIEITWARVGRIDKGDVPVGDLFFLPSDPTALMDPPLSKEPIPAQVHVTSVTIKDVVEVDGPFNSQQFVALGDPVPTNPKRQIPDEILIRLANTLWELRMRPRIDPDGNVVEMLGAQASVFVFLAAMNWALNTASLGWNAENPRPNLRPIDKKLLNSGKYRTGRIEGQFTLTPREGDDNINIPNILALAEALNGRLSTIQRTYAMEGEILGPDESGTNQEEKAKWELTAKENEDQGE